MKLKKLFKIKKEISEDVTLEANIKISTELNYKDVNIELPKIESLKIGFTKKI